MIRRPIASAVLLTLLTPASSAAQIRINLNDALARARAHNVDARVAEAAEREAGERVAQARAGYLPRVDLTEGWQRGNQPVFVFSSLLAQRDFTAANFAIDALNHPDAVNNFRVALVTEQPLYTPSTGAAIRSAELGRSVAMAGRGLVQQELGVAVADAYGQVLVATASKEAAAAAVAAATADRERAANRRDAGLATEADVLQVDVHLARMREQQIRAAADERIARARLNQIMGESLDAVFVLDDAPGPGGTAGPDVAVLEEEAVLNRPEIQVARLQQELAGATHDAAKATFLPQVSALAGWEGNGAQWSGRASSWTVGIAVRITLFQGFADRARLAEARAQAARRDAEREKAETSARLDVRVAAARLDAARAAEAVGRAAADQARESQRIIRDRYDAGVADITTLLRAAETVAHSDRNQVAARVEVLLAQAALDRAAGRR